MFRNELIPRFYIHDKCFVQTCYDTAIEPSIPTYSPNGVPPLRRLSPADSALAGEVQDANRQR